MLLSKNGAADDGIYLDAFNFVFSFQVAVYFVRYHFIFAYNKKIDQACILSLPLKVLHWVRLVHSVGSMYTGDGLSDHEPLFGVNVTGHSSTYGTSLSCGKSGQCINSKVITSTACCAADVNNRCFRCAFLYASTIFIFLNKLCLISCV